MFESALYYPTIDIKNDYWLKSAVLFWDRIETIVPESIQQPYQRRTTRQLEDAGILIPHRINPFSEEVRGLEQDVAKYLKTKEGKRSFLKPWSSIVSFANKRRSFNDDEIEQRLRREYDDFYIHVEKLPMMLHDQLEGRENEDGFILARNGFMSFYMTLLANRICQNNNLSLLTDKAKVNGFSKKILTDGVSQNLRGRELEGLQSGVMYEIMMEDINIDPTTPIEMIIRYKTERADELGRFREEMDRLTDFNIEGMTAGDIENQLKRIYENQVIPALNDVKTTLKEGRIEWWMNQASSYLLCGIVPTAITLSNPGALSAVALGISYGLSLTLSVVNYVRHNRAVERRNPYTYLLKMNKAFSNAGRG